jgi:hypothetical protein
MHVHFVKLRNPDQVDAMAAKINTELPGNTIQPTKEIFAGFEKTIPFLGVFLRVLVGLAAVVSALVVMLAMYTTITKEHVRLAYLRRWELLVATSLESSRRKRF